MIRKIFAIAAVAGMLAATPSMAANSCRDAKGKFIKCQTTSATTPAKKSAATPAKPAAAPAKPAAAAAAAPVIKGKDGKCRFSSGPKKGQFAKCR